jgi:hypothetical protein
VLAEATGLSTRCADSYLRVLSAERDSFQGQLVHAQLRLGEWLAFVDLYSSFPARAAPPGHACTRQDGKNCAVRRH